MISAKICTTHVAPGDVKSFGTLNEHRPDVLIWSLAKCCHSHITSVYVFIWVATPNRFFVNLKHYLAPWRWCDKNGRYIEVYPVEPWGTKRWRKITEWPGRLLQRAPYIAQRYVAWGFVIWHKLAKLQFRHWRSISGYRWHVCDSHVTINNDLRQNVMQLRMDKPHRGIQ